MMQSRAEYFREHRQQADVKERNRHYQRKWRENNRDKARAKNARWARAHPEKVREKQFRVRKRAKYEAFVAYGGPACMCCGEAEFEFLTIEHTRGDGAAHRKTLASGGRGIGSWFYTWLRQHEYPDDLGLEVLCSNCQRGRAYNCGVCPHEEKS